VKNLKFGKPNCRTCLEMEHNHSGVGRSPRNHDRNRRQDQNAPQFAIPRALHVRKHYWRDHRDVSMVAAWFPHLPVGYLEGFGDTSHPSGRFVPTSVGNRAIPQCSVA
jgi:hypothetical protein